MVFIIIPDHQLLVFDKILAKIKSKISKNFYNIYKVDFASMSVDEDNINVYHFSLDSDNDKLTINIEQNKTYELDSFKSLNKMYKGILTDLSEKETICFIPKSIFVNLAEYIELNFTVEHYKLDDGTNFDYVESSILLDSDNETFMIRKENDHAIHSLHTKRQ